MFILRSCAVLTLAAGMAVQAQQVASPPAKVLGAIQQKSAELLGAVSQARALSDGRVLVNDVAGRRVVLFEKDLQRYTVVADTTSATGNAYAGRAGSIVAWRGDTSVFIEPQSLSMMLVHPDGTLGRVMSFPRPNDAMALMPGLGGIPAFDGAGHLIYRAPPAFNFRAGPGGPNATPRAPGAAPSMPELPDSIPVIRVELATRKVDTVASVKVPRPRMSVTADSAGRMMMTSIVHPLPQVDDWAVLSDGSVAIVRGLDYHVEFMRPDGTRHTGGKIPFDWRHLDDSAKVAFVDSAKAAMERMRAQANVNRPAGAPPTAMAGIEGGAQPMVMVFRAEGPARGGDGNTPRGRAEAGGPNFSTQIPPLQMVEPRELPDYAPPFTTGAARADADGNLWIRTSKVVNGGSVYDVIDAEGKLVDRVQLPAGRVIAGFGKGGVIYMGVREGTGVRLEQAAR